MYQVHSVEQDQCNVTTADCAMIVADEHGLISLTKSMQRSRIRPDFMEIQSRVL